MDPLSDFINGGKIIMQILCK